MISKKEYERAKETVLDALGKAGIVLTERERSEIEVADFGLGDLAQTGLQIVTYVNTSRVCAKELVLTPHQTCPEHRHPGQAGQPGKEETFRCRVGEVYLYVEGMAAQRPACRPPNDRTAYYTVFREIRLLPGEQYTLKPDSRHWFQSGDQGAVVSEFSTHSNDAGDIFTDPKVVRTPQVEPDETERK